MYNKTIWISLMLVAIVISFIVLIVDNNCNPVEVQTYNEPLVELGHEFCDDYGFEYIDVIPINEFKSKLEGKHIEYFFCPVGTNEWFLADNLIEMDYDTSFVLRFTDSSDKHFIAIIR